MATPPSRIHWPANAFSLAVQLKRVLRNLGQAKFIFKINILEQF
jgi:hypothetical protein